MPQTSSLTTTLAAVAVTCMACAASAADTTSTNIVRNPTGGYTQRSVEIPPGSRILFISGQTATDAEGFTPPDAETQADIVYAKVEQTLKDAGMDWSDVVKTNLYMINPADIGAIVKAGQKYNPGGTQAGTLVYVKALALPEVLIELEAVAAKKE
ncbi:MAG: RidA family protein [Rhodospirillaceae bacterium]